MLHAPLHRRHCLRCVHLQIAAYALELYNEELRDLHPQARDSPQGGLKLQERPTKDGRVVPEVRASSAWLHSACAMAGACGQPADTGC
jgi:hypothetical protein